MNVGKRIAQLREAQGMSQALFSEKIGINRSVLNRIEFGTRPVRDNELRDIANFFHVSADYLLGNEPQVKVFPPDNAPPKEGTPIDSLVAELFADNPSVLSLLQGSEIFARPLEGENLTNITAEQKETIKNALLLGLRAAGLKVD